MATTNGKPTLRVLIIEDNPDDVLLIVHELKREWRVVWHRVESEAGMLISLEEKWDFILCDVALPQFSAERALLVAREYFSVMSTTLPPFIAISGVVDEEEGVRLFKMGARDFISKDKLYPRLSVSIRREQRQRDELLVSKLKVEEAYDAIIAAWGKALELRDVYTAGHTERVTALALRLAIALNVSRKEFVALNRGAYLHDIGKIAIKDEILLKPGMLTEEEMQEMKKHPTYAAKMLSQIPFLADSVVVPLYHHERWDGTGYPEGKKGTDIPFLARLFAIIDVYDALVTERPYRKAWEQSKAIAFLLEEAGKTFDADIVRVFVEMLGRG